MKPCSTKTGRCKERSVTYMIECRDCKMEGRKSCYWGETNRTFHDRMKEHVEGLRRMEEANPLFKHWLDVHPGGSSPPSFNFHLVGVHRSSLERQLQEALAISRDESEHPMNSRMEFGRNGIVVQRVTVDGYDWKEERRRRQEVEESEGRKVSSHREDLQPAGKRRREEEEGQKGDPQVSEKEETGFMYRGKNFQPSGIVRGREERKRMAKKNSTENDRKKQGTIKNWLKTKDQA